MTTIGCRVEDKMQRQRNDDKTMCTAQPAGWILRLWQRVARRIGVGVEGSQGGGRREGELGENCAPYSWWS
jgi:hypothetical protein